MTMGGRLWVLAAALAAGTALGAGRPTRPLDGTWNFRLDEQGSGEAGRWFEPHVPLPDTIQVPGAWGAQGFGTPTEKVRHHFVGKAWYRRRVRVPDSWRGKRLFLTVGGVHRYAKVWVNGALLGEHIGYLSAFEYEITRHVEPGSTATIAICVESKQRWDVDALTGACDLIDAMFVPWGGIWGHVALEARGPAWLEDLFVRPEAEPPACRVTAKLAGAEVAEGSVALAVFDSEGNLAAKAQLPLKRALSEGRELSIRVEVPNARLWSPSTPHLYTARLSLERPQGALDSVGTRFGLRTIEIRGPHIYLNGRKVFLHGYGDDCVFPKTVAAPSDKVVYLERLRLAKDYGFNYVRHHSHFMPPEYYAAADEVGILISPELPIAYLSYYRRAKGAALELYKSQWAEAIRRHRNHPAILDWCMGNEMWDGVPIAPDLYRIAKSLDPTRPVIDSNGLRGRGWLDGSRSRPTLDFHLVMFDLHHLPLGRPDRHRFDKPPKPVVSHETGNFITFPRLDAIGNFTHNIKPFWLTATQAKLERLGLLDEAETWARNSEKLYLLCHKLNLEDIRKNPFLSGYQWWLLQDYWTGSNGIVDHYFRPKPGVPAKSVRRFNADVVLLLDGLDVTCRGAQPIEATLLCSNYAPKALREARLTWEAKLGGKTLARRELKNAEIGQGAVKPMAAVTLDLPNPSSPQQLTIEAEMAVGERTWRNDWSAWVYPAAIAPPRLDVPLFASPELVRPLAKYGAKPLPGGERWPGRAVYAMSLPTVEAVDALASGACLLLLSPQGVFPSAPNRFKTAWWLGNARDNNVGTVVYENAVTRGLAPEGWCDAGWYHLLEGAQAFILDELPAQPEVLVRAIEVHSLCRSKALLFEAKVGEGALMVSGFKLALDEEPPRPEREWLLARLLEHAGARPMPEAEFPVAFLRQRAAAIAPPEGPFVLGFQRLVRNEGEDGTWHSYREDNTRFHVCRQTEPGHEVEWETAPVPEALGGEGVTFVFAGGLGWVSEPKTKGMTFRVNGRDALHFDVTQDRGTWESGDGSVKLHFVPRRRLPLDAVGLFYVTVAPGLLEAGQPCRFAVRSEGRGSRRWFGLNPYTDILGPARR
jgi:hypothetical protein